MATSESTSSSSRPLDAVDRRLLAELQADGRVSVNELAARAQVARATAAVIPRLFSRNERVACWFSTERGTMVVVLVGALNVSSISTFAHGESRSGTAQQWIEDSPRRVARSDEIGRFNMGSTVVVLLESGALEFAPDVADGLAVRMGRALGTFSQG